MSDFEEVVKLIDSVKDEGKLEDFLVGLTTEDERKKFVQRVQIIKRLLAGEPQHTIAHDLGVGIATVTRGSKALNEGRFKVLREFNNSGDSETLIGSKELNQILAKKRKRLQVRKTLVPEEKLDELLNKVGPFQGPSLFEVLKSNKKIPKIIAEVKQTSPSAKSILNNSSLEKINQAYQSSDNVIAISIITEEDSFLGSNEILRFFADNNYNNKPLLRKDFIEDAYEVKEAKVLGAQAYLLIAALFKNKTAELNELIDLGYKLGIEPLVEVHNQEELDIVKGTNAKIIGVNCRDLKTFRTNPELHDLLKEIDGSKYAKVAESGISERPHLIQASTLADGALIGSRFMRAKDINKAIIDLIGPAQSYFKADQ